jgi:hypothetical protein
VIIGGLRWGMASKIPPVPLPVPDPDRVLNCEFELEGAFNELAERALAVGWSDDEVEAALLSLARHRVLARIERQRTGRLIDKAMRQ